MVCARATVVLSLGLGLVSTPARAEPADLQHDLRVDIPVTVVAASTAIGLNLVAGSLTPSCRWCASNGLDDAVRAALVRRDPAPARFTSDTFVVAAPVLALGVGALVAADEGRTSEIPLNALLVAEATSVAMALNAVAKVTFARERPYAHALADAQKGGTPDPADNNVSFFSGHTAFTFALVTSAGTIAQMRGYRLAPVVWGVGLPLAAATGYLRIAADRHYFTDVVGGMIVGALAGVAIPLLFHRPMSERVAFGAPVAGGQVFSLTFPSPI